MALLYASVGDRKAKEQGGMADHDEQERKQQKKQRRFRPRFGMKVVLGLTTSLCVFLGVLYPFIQRQRVEQKAIEDLSELYSGVGFLPELAFDYQFGEKSLSQAKQPEPTGPKIVRSILGEHIFSTVKSVKLFEGPCDNVKSFKDLSPVLREFANLEELTVVDLGFDEGSDILKAWPRMRHLQLNSCSGLEDVSGLRELDRLESLGLGMTGIRSIEPLSNCSNMKEINLVGCKELTNAELVANFVQLEALEQAYCPKIKSLDYLKKFENLKSLSCSSSDHFKNFDFALIANNTELETLMLFGFETFQNIEQLTQFESLRFLRIEGCDGLTELPSLAGMRQLDSVSIASCPIANINGLRDSKSVTALTLVRCNELKQIQSISNLDRLQSLVFECDGVEDLNVLKKMESLRHLTFSCKSIKNLEMVPSKNLDQIRVWNCPDLTDISRLAKCQSTAFITLQNCPKVTQESIFEVEDESGLMIQSF